MGRLARRAEARIFCGIRGGNRHGNGLPRGIPVFSAGFDLAVEREKRAAVGQPESFGESDLYPDARPAMAGL